MEHSQKNQQKQIKTKITNQKAQPQTKKQSFVNVRACSWKQAKNQLFDYKAENDSFFFQNFKIQKETHVYRGYSNNITTLAYQEGQNTNTQDKNYICRIQFAQNKKKVNVLPFTKKTINSQTPQSNQDVFLVVNSKLTNPQYQGYSLKVGDIVKFGYAAYLIYEINDSKQSKSIIQVQCSSKNNQVYKVEEQIQRDQLCRICYIEGHTQLNPLINPCLCKGHTKYTHFQCLKPWVNGKVRSQIEVNGIVITFNYEKFQCQICKQKYPQIIKLTNEEEIFLLDFKKPDRPYILLKSISGQYKDPKKLHFICPQNGKIKIGRSENCDLIQSRQNTVSRDHAQIELKSGQFLMSDLNSKFGTLVKLHNKISLTSKEQVRLQYKNTMYTIAMNRKTAS